jgi:hypothetical protein
MAGVRTAAVVHTAGLVATRPPIVTLHSLPRCQKVTKGGEGGEGDEGERRVAEWGGCLSVSVMHRQR